MDVISDTPLAVAEGNTDYTFLGIERRLGRLALRQLAESSPVIGEEEAFAAKRNPTDRRFGLHFRFRIITINLWAFFQKPASLYIFLIDAKKHRRGTAPFVITH